MVEERSDDTTGRVLRDLGRTACVQDKNWGVNKDSIWVNGGCRAVFGAAQSGGGRAPAISSKATLACQDAGDGPADILSTTALSPGNWEVVLHFDDGKFVCSVNDAGQVSGFKRLR